MTFRFSPYAWLLIGSGVAAGVVAYLAYRRRSKYVARWLFWMSLSVMWWSITYGLHVAGNDFATQYFFNRIKYLGAIFSSPLWFLLAYSYTHAPQRLPPRKQVLVLASAGVFLLPVLLDPLWHTWWPHITTFYFHGYLALETSHSVYYGLFAIVAFSWMIIGLGLYIQHYIRFPTQRPQLRWLILAGLLPLLGNFATQLGLSPLPWGLDPFLFALSMLFLAIAVLKERFLDTLPLAHRLIIEHLPQGVIVLDNERKIVDLNPAAQALCAMSTPHPQGKALDSVVNDEVLLSHLLFAVYQQPDELIEVSLDSPRRTLALWAKPIQIEGTTQGYIVTLENITRRKQLEEELAKARDMAVVASTLKSRLLATATQDIRHPAGMVVGYLESLLSGVYGPLSQEQAQAVAFALEQSNQMIGFLSNLMGYAEIESGAVMFANKPFAPEELVQPVRPLLEAVARAKGLEMLWEIDPNLPERLYGDVEWLRRVLTNLLNNAVNYTTFGHIRARIYRVDEEHWAIEVRDTGRGIHPQQQKRLFDLRHARGLGLVVVRGLVEQMGGELRLSSIVGRGSTFTAVLPLRTREEGREPPEEKGAS